ncbi:MAG: glucose-1-phosphate adenylyltransferase [Christensenellaceae bacterium]|jgi:glucose-1-phosphate adenylyltransferase|nr:glucose-1-phosphate adenylyltransferase [Christensenellaceae bacterium]
MIKKKIIAMLLAGGQGSRLSVLTNRIAKPAMPFGGRYRIIDFPLSNCANSDIDTVGVLTQYEPMELNGYIGTGQAWDLDRNSGGVFVLPPYISGSRGEWYSGTANAIYQNIAFIDRYDPEYVLILSGDHIYRMDYAQMLARHVESNADATIAVRGVPIEEAHRFGIMNTDAEGNIIEFEEKPRAPKSNKASMGIYIFSWEQLRQYLIADEATPDSENDFGQNIIPAMLRDKRRMIAYEFKSYWKDVGTIQSLWEANMDIIAEPPLLDLSGKFFNDREWRIFSKSPIMPPHYVGPQASIERSIITEGCEIDGTVTHSVIFAGVTVEPEAEVIDSVLLPGARVQRGAHVRKAIIGENSVVGEAATVGAARQPGDGDYDTSLTGDITLIASGTEIAAGSHVPVGMIVNTGLYGGKQKEA